MSVYHCPNPVEGLPPLPPKPPTPWNIPNAVLQLLLYTAVNSKKEMRLHPRSTFAEPLLDLRFSSCRYSRPDT